MTFNKANRLSAEGRNTRSSRTNSLEESSSASRASRRSSSQNIFRRFSNSRASNTSTIPDDWERGGAADPLALGAESNVASAPRQWLVVMGPRASGKSTLIRQLKIAHDGADASEAARFAREARKVALDLIKETATAVAPTLSGEAEKKAAERLQGLREGARDARLGAHVPGRRLKDGEEELRDARELRVAHAVLELEEREQRTHRARRPAQEDRAQRVFGMIRERLALRRQLVCRHGHGSPNVDAHGRAQGTGQLCPYYAGTPVSQISNART